MKRINDNIMNPTYDCLINNLLEYDDVAGYIASYFNDQDIQSSVRVDKFWNKKIIHVTKTENYISTTRSAKFFADNLSSKSYPTEVAQLLEIVNGKKIVDCPDLGVWSSAEDLKEKLLYVLMDIKENDLNNLEKLTENEKNPHLKNLIALAKIYKIIDVTLEEFEENDADYPSDEFDNLANLCINLIKLDAFNKALDILEDIKCYVTYPRFCVKIAESGLIDEAIKALIITPDFGFSIPETLHIAFVIIKNKGFDEAIKFTKTLVEILKNFDGCADIIDFGQDDDFKCIYEAAKEVSDEEADRVFKMLPESAQKLCIYHNEWYDGF